MKKIILIILILAIAGFLLVSRNQDKSISENGGQENTSSKTEVKSIGLGGIKMVISPSEGKIVKGVVTIDLTKIPDNTGVVAFGIQEQGSENMSGGLNLGLDTDGSDGWNYLLDTTNYENGVYTVFSIAGVSFEEGQEPIGGATVQIIIEN